MKFDPLELILAATIVATVLLVVAGIYQHSQSPDLATLKKHEWQCTKTSTHLMPVGKVIVPRRQCNEYQRISN